MTRHPLELDAMDLPRILPLFRALHNFHVAHLPHMHHASGTDQDYLDVLKEKAAKGAWFFGHDLGWGLGSYLMAVPDSRPANAFDLPRAEIHLNHIYVTPQCRGRGWTRALIDAATEKTKRAGYASWYVGFAGFNDHAADIYASLTSERAFGGYRKWI